MSVVLIVIACGQAGVSSPGQTAPGGPTATAGAVAPSTTGSPSAAGPPSGAAPSVRVTAPPAPTPYGVVGTPFPTSAPAAAVTLEPGPSSTRVRFGPIAFDIPKGWEFRPANVDEHEIDVVGFLGTAPSTAACWPMANGVTCTSDLRLSPGDVSILLMTQNGPALPNPRSFETTRDPTARVVPINGVPALLLRPETSPGSLALNLMVLDPASFGTMLRLDVSAMDANVDTLRAQVEAVFASVHYDPPITPVAASATEQRRLVTVALGELDRGNSGGFGCFPTTPGSVAQARIRRFPGNGFDVRERTVTCRTDLAPDPLGYWRLTLTITWGTTDRLVVTEWLAIDGNPVGSWFDGSPPSQ